jgi:hypothetical protein
MELTQRHIDALNEAETLMFHCDFCPYLELKELFTDRSDLRRRRFRLLFTDYYGLNVAGLTDVFIDRFFEILFTGTEIVNGQPDFSAIFSELCSIPRRKGDSATQFSFVSKLVAMHRESSPIYDKHVLAFFGRKFLPNQHAMMRTVLRALCVFYGMWRAIMAHGLKMSE